MYGIDVYFERLIIKTQIKMSLNYLLLHPALLVNLFNKSNLRESKSKAQIFPEFFINAER